MKSILGQIYCGGVQPLEKPYPRNGAHQKLMDASREKYSAFRELLQSELLRAVNEVEDAELALIFENGKYDFMDGFRLRAQVMLEVLMREEDFRSLE